MQLLTFELENCHICHFVPLVMVYNQWCPAVGARGSAALIVFQLVGAPLPYFVNIFELVNDKYCTI